MTQIEKMARGFVADFEARGGKFWIEDGQLYASVNGKQSLELARKVANFEQWKRDALMNHLQWREAARPAEVTTVEWDAIFREWTVANCAWRERCYGSKACLYVDMCEWCAVNDKPLASDVGAFGDLLTRLGFDVRDGFVYGLIVRADANATDFRAPVNDFARLTSPDAVALDKAFPLPTRKDRAQKKN